MALSLLAKLKIKSGMTLITLHAPNDFAKKLQISDNDVKITVKAKSYDQIHWFVLNRTQMESELANVMDLLKEPIICWIYYPKKTSSIQTDLTRDKGWDKLLKYEKLKWISLVSFNETWSTFGMRVKTPDNEKNESVKKVREIFDYIDVNKKTVTLPPDFALALQKKSKAEEFFETLSFTNRKEYVEWIITAKREETRKQRVENSIKKLLEKRKNPSSS